MRVVEPRQRGERPIRRAVVDEDHLQGVQWVERGLGLLEEGDARSSSKAGATTEIVGSAATPVA